MDAVAISKRIVFKKSDIGNRHIDIVTIIRKKYVNENIGFYIYDVENRNGQIYEIIGKLGHLKINSQHQIKGYVVEYKNKLKVNVLKISYVNFCDFDFEDDGKDDIAKWRTKKLRAYLKTIIGSKEKILFDYYGDRLYYVLIYDKHSISKVKGIGEKTLNDLIKNINL
ncbi:hypothetical protein [Clostridium massiliamazoniense]|uniref:hypothetical protein n=1 Tax=Clostridium massiliamazoniense TaxID=1347366 RepID=UPI0006D8618E|nr:hypothetical protein [Clostridium massiliamazoniense]